MDDRPDLLTSLLSSYSWECYGVSTNTLRRKLTAVGINCNSAGGQISNNGYWKITTNSSITGPNTFELVSPILQGEVELTELMKVCKVLNDSKAIINRSCGIHVHINARNFTLEQWKQLYINYSRLESVIDRWMVQSRRANISTYCKEFIQITNFERKINDSTSLIGICGILNNGHFWKVNPQSYSGNNMVEFRQHAGTTNYVKLAA